MLEGVEVEVGAEPRVEHGEHVLVERGGDAGGVVVGGLERLPVLDQVGAQQEAVVGPEQVGDAREEAGPLLRLEVADRPAEERDHARPPSGIRSRSRSKSQTSPWTAMPYSSAIRAAVSRVISSEMSTGA